MKKYLNRQTIYSVLIIVSVVAIIWWALARVNFDLKDSNIIDYLFFNPFWAVVVVLVDRFFNEKNIEELKIYKGKISSAGGAISTARDMGDGKSITIKSILNALSGDELIDIEIQKQKAQEFEDVAKRAGQTKKSKKNIDTF